MFYKGLALLFRANSSRTKISKINGLRRTLNVMWEENREGERALTRKRKRRDATGVERPSEASPRRIAVCGPAVKTRYRDDFPAARVLRRNAQIASRNAKEM